MICKAGGTYTCLDCGRVEKRKSNVQKRCHLCGPKHNYVKWTLAKVKRGERRYPGSNRTGPGNGGWKGGVSRKWWRKFRKKFCEKCGTRKRRLVVHHKDTNSRNGSPNNFQTLCDRCHRREHLRLKGFKKYEDPF